MTRDTKVGYFIQEAEGLVLVNPCPGSRIYRQGILKTGESRSISRDLYLSLQCS